jgi:hypothetical protein
MSISSYGRIGTPLSAAQKCKTELANSQNWPITMYRTTELANFAGLANSAIFMKLTILVILVFGVLTGLTYSPVSPKAGLAIATSPSPLVKTQCFIQLLDSLFYRKLHS